MLKVAVTSQNRRTITEHAGRCRNFWIYQVEQDRILDKSLLELPQNQSFHDHETGTVHPLDAINVLITASMGPNLYQYLKERHVQTFITQEHEPDLAVQALCRGVLDNHLSQILHHEHAHPA